MTCPCGFASSPTRRLPSATPPSFLPRPLLHPPHPNTSTPRPPNPSCTSATTQGKCALSSLLCRPRSFPSPLHSPPRRSEGEHDGRPYRPPNSTTLPAAAASAAVGWAGRLPLAAGHGLERDGATVRIGFACVRVVGVGHVCSVCLEGPLYTSPSYPTSPTLPLLSYLFPFCFQSHPHPCPRLGSCQL